jgi:putative transposase
MARANRHYIPGSVWHISHRCHKKEFLLRFARDRQSWLQWLFEGKKRFGTCILNYAVTPNHVHLLVKDGRKGEVIPQTLQLIAGRTGQEYNRRKNRKGAFWEDRYHIKAIGREVVGSDGVYELRERDVSYNVNFAGERSGLRPENTFF